MTDIKKYKVLARKYRPTKFEDLIGQDTLVQILTNSIKNNRIVVIPKTNFFLFCIKKFLIFSFLVLVLIIDISSSILDHVS